VKHESFKNKLCVSSIIKVHSYAKDNNHASSFMVILAMEYSYEQPTVVGELIFES